jgi:hypothetical protein
MQAELRFHLEEDADSTLRNAGVPDRRGRAAGRAPGRWAIARSWTGRHDAPRGALDERLEQIGRDAGFGLRQVRRDPSVSAIAIRDTRRSASGVESPRMFAARSTRRP